MTTNWFEGVKRKSEDVDRYIESRHRAYLDRWNEALRFVPHGATVLDIGGGNLFPRLLERFKELELDYWYLDVDQSAVGGARNLASTYGFNSEQFDFGFNDELKFEAEKFDAIFSSHCIEHSFDLQKTLAELHRVLKAGGMLLMAVPFGWELNPEHPYFLEASHWLSMLEDTGFMIRVAQVGREYPEHGHDLFVAALKQERSGSLRIDPMAYRKSDMEYVSPYDSRITYVGNTADGTEGSIICSGDWSVAIRVDTETRRVLPILQRHDWSAVVELRAGSSRCVVDLYSWYSYPQPVQFRMPEDAQQLEIRPIGKNELSRSNEGVVVGFLLAKK